MKQYRGAISLISLLAAGSVFADGSGSILPTEGTITSGQGSITSVSNQLTITQHTRVMDTSWSSFDIGGDATVSVRQPSASSTLIGRVNGGRPSNIDGTLTANGRVVLINPNGIHFGANSRVDVGGIVASSLNLNGHGEHASTLLFEGGSGATVRQDGVIKSDLVALVGGKVEQFGKIEAANGDAALLAGDRVEISIGGSGRISAKIDAEAGAGSVLSTGTITADNGNVLIKADAASALLSKAIHGEQSQELVFKDGRLVLMNVDGNVKAKNIRLDAGDAGVAVVSGNLDTTQAEGGTGGDIQVLGGAVHLKGTAILNASGVDGGGKVEVGGSWQNSDPLVRQSLITRVENGAQLVADALRGGDGGEVVVWSDVKSAGSLTTVSGRLSASALGFEGSGGRVETSGYGLDTSGVRVEASAVNGSAGIWLVDPYNITIESATSNASATGGNYTATGSSATIDVADIATSLVAGTNVSISTAGAGAQDGNIVWDAPLDVTLSSDVSLSLVANADISINQKIEANSAGTGSLGVLLNTNLAGGAGSNVVIGANILTNGGDITIGGGSSGDGSGYVVGPGHAVEINESIRSFGGDITIKGKSISNSGDWAGVLVNSRQIYADSGQIALYGQFASYQGSGLRFDIDWNILNNGWVPTVGVPDGVDNRASRSILYSASPLDNAVYLYGASNQTQNWAGDTQVSINFQYTGTMLTNRGGMSNTPPIFASGGGNVVLETEELAAHSGSKIRLTNGVYVNGGEYHLYAPDGFAPSPWHSGTTYTIGLDRLSGVYSYYLGTTGNPKTIIRTDTSDTLKFHTRSAGDFSLYGFTNSETLPSDFSVAMKYSPSAATTADITFEDPISNMRLTGGDVRLRRILADNVQVVADKIYINDYDTTYNPNGYVCAGSGIGNLGVCYSSFGTSDNPIADVYLKASTSIQDSQTNTLTYDARMHVEDLIIESPLVMLRYGGLGNDSGRSFYAHHLIDRIAVKGVSDTIYVANGKALEIGTLSATAIDPSFSNTLTDSSVSGVSISNILIAETSSGNLTVTAPISSTGIGDGKAESFGNYYNYPVILNAGYSDIGHTDGSLVFSSNHGFTLANNTKALLFTGGVDETVGIGSYIGDGASRFGARKSNLSQPDVQTASGITGLTAFSAALNAIYREQPVINVAPAAAEQSVVYGSSINTDSVASGLTGADTSATVLAGSVNYSINGATSSSGNYAVGNHTLSFSGLTNSVGYHINYTNGSVAVTAKPVTVSYTALDKTYDADTSATVNDTLIGIIPGDTVTTQEAAVFDDANVAYSSGSVVSKTITISLTQLHGADGANYSLETTNYTASAKINPKIITVSGSRPYDGTPTFLASDLSVSTGIIGENLSLVGVATANDSNVAAASHLSDVNSLTLQNGSGGLAENYSISTAQDNSVSVSKRVVGLSFSRSYNGKKLAAAADFTVTTGVDGEDLNITGNATLNSSNVSLANRLSSGGSLALADGASGLAANYDLPNISEVSASLSPYVVTGTPNAVSKTYDTSADAPVDITLSYTANTVLGYSGLSVEYGYTGGSFDSTDVTVTAFTYTGGAVTSASYPNPGNGVIDETPLVSDFSLSETRSVSGTIRPYIIDGNAMSFSVTGNPTVAQFDESHSTITVTTNDTITFLPAVGTTLSAHQSGTSYFLHNNTLAGATIYANGALSSNYAFITDTSYNMKDEYAVTGTKQFLEVVARPDGSTYRQEYDGTIVVGSGFTQQLNSYNYPDQEWNTYWIIKNQTTGDFYTPVQIFGRSDRNLSSAGVLLTDYSGVDDIYRGLTFDAVFDHSDAGNRVITISNVTQNIGGSIGDNFDANYTFVDSQIPAEITPRVLDVQLDYPGYELSKYYDGNSNIAVEVTLSSSSQIVPGDTVSLATSQTLAAYDYGGSEIINATNGSQSVVLPETTSFAIEGEDARNYVARIHRNDRYHQLRVIPKILSLDANKPQANGSDFALDQVTISGAVPGENIIFNGVTLTEAQVRQSALVNLGNGPEIPDPTNSTQVNYIVNNWGATEQQATNYLTSQQSKYDNAADQPALDYPFLAATVSGRDLTEASSPGVYSLVAKRLSSGDLSVKLISPDDSANVSNYCLTDCRRVDGSFASYDSVWNNDVDGILMDGLWTATITAPPTIGLELTGFSLLDKIYDGTRSGGLSLVSNWGALSGNFSGADQSTVTLDHSGATLTFSQADVGYGVNVTVANLGLSGANSSSYSLANFVASTDITARPIAITATSVTKTYGDADPTLSVTAAAATATTGLAQSDSISEVVGTISRESGEAVGSYDVRLGNGVKKANYAVSFNSDNGALTINKRSITLNASSATKVYGEVDPALSVNVASGSLASNAVADTLAAVTGSLSREAGSNAGTYDIRLGTGSATANYDITFAEDNNAFSITRKALTATGTVSDKTYDGSDEATISMSLSNLVGAETLTASVDAAFGSANAGTRTATVSGVTLVNGPDGGLANNYTLSVGGITLSDAGQAVISPRALRATATVSDKVYDKTVAADVMLSFDGLVGSEDLGQTVAASFNSALAGTRQATIDSFSISNGTAGLAANYSLSGGDIDFSSNSATIARKSLSVSGAGTASNKVYDGTTSVTADISGITFSGLLAGDSLGTPSASFSDANAGSNKAVSISFTGGDGANYVVPSVSGLTATISPKALTGAASVSNKTYDGNTSADVSLALSGVVSGETLDTTVIASFDSAEIGLRTAQIGSVSLLDGTGIAENYSLALSNILFTNNTAIVTPVGAAYRLGKENLPAKLVDARPLLILVSDEGVNALPAVQRTLPPAIEELQNLQNTQISQSEETQEEQTQAISEIDEEQQAGSLTLLTSADQSIAQTPQSQASSDIVFTLRDARSESLESLMLTSSEPLLISASDASTITSLRRVDPIEIEEDQEEELPLREVFPEISLTDDVIVAISFINGNVPQWVSVNRISQSIIIKPPSGVQGLQTLRLGVADEVGNMAAISLRVVVSPRNVQADRVVNQDTSIEQPTINLARSPVQDLPGFLSVQALKPTRFAAGSRFVFEVPNGTFVHEDSGEPLRYVATLSDGSPLPSWMTFDPATQTFSGEAPNGTATQLDVIVKAVDSASQEAQVQLRVQID